MKNMKNFLKRTLSLMLCICMCMGMMVFVAEDAEAAISSGTDSSGNAYIYWAQWASSDSTYEDLDDIYCDTNYRQDSYYYTDTDGRNSLRVTSRTTGTDSYVHFTMVSSAGYGYNTSTRPYTAIVYKAYDVYDSNGALTTNGGAMTLNVYSTTGPTTQTGSTETGTTVVNAYYPNLNNINYTLADDTIHYAIFNHSNSSGTCRSMRLGFLPGCTGNLEIYGIVRAGTLSAAQAGAQALTALWSSEIEDTADRSERSEWTGAISFYVNFDLDGGTYNGSTTFSPTFVGTPHFAPYNPTGYSYRASDPAKKYGHWRYYNMYFNMPAGTPTKTGYTFGGWGGKYENDITSLSDTVNPYVLQGDPSDSGVTTDYAITIVGKQYNYAHNHLEPATVTSYAIWDPIEYSISYTLGGGSISGQPTSYTIESGTVSIPNPTRTGYTFTGWSGTGLSGSSNKNVSFTPSTTNLGNRSYTANWAAATDTKYTVYHQQQQLDGTYKTVETDTLYGTTGNQVTPARRTYSGFNTPTAQTVTIAADGSTTVTYQYSRIKYNVTLGSTTGISSTSGAGSYYHGASVTVSAEVASGYSWNGWSGTYDSSNQSYTFTMPIGDVNLTANAASNTVTVRWIVDGSVVETDTVNYGETPVYNGSTPTKAGNAQYSYTFSDWSPVVGPVYANTDYTAQFTQTTNTYTVTWKNENGTVLETDENVEYGAMPEYNGATPTKAATAQYTYTHSGWTPTVSTVTGDATYTATFTESINSYTVTWVNEDGTVLETDENVAYGTEPTYDGSTPTKAGNAQFSYTFDKWSPAIYTVTGDATYTATFTESINSYTVTWVNEDGTVLETDENVEYGAMPTYDGATPSKAETAQYTYTHSGWTPTVSTVTGDVTYTATYEKTVNSYTVTWLNDDESLLRTDTLTYGATPSYDSDPTKAADDAYTYTFAGWTPEVVEVTGNAVYTATYSKTPIPYTITFDEVGGTEVEDITYDVETPVTYLPDTTKPGYEFGGWEDKDGNPVTNIPVGSTGDVELTATWTPIEYTITYNGLEGATISENPGTYTIETETFTLNNPTKDGYTFAGWTGTDITGASLSVTVAKGSMGDREYTATWTENTATITYYVVAGEGGKVYLNNKTEADAALSVNETVGVVTGDPAGATAVPDNGYAFAGWFATEDCTGDAIETDVTYTPDRPSAAVIYYAKFEVAISFLIIDNNGANMDVDENQSFIFNVVGIDENTEGISLTVTVHGNGETKIVGVPVGKYQVTEQSGWSWRYADMATQEVTVDADGETVTFSDIRDEEYWLSGDSRGEYWLSDPIVIKKDEYVA